MKLPSPAQYTFIRSCRTWTQKDGPRATVRACLKAGWLEKDDGGRLNITTAGVAAIDAYVADREKLLESLKGG